MLVLAKGTVVLGLVVLMRTGLVSFGQGLYFGIGAYAAALLSHHFRIADAAAMLLAGAVAAGAVAALLGLLLANYREIFFAMLSLAFSMILYGLLVKSAALGSTDGLHLQARTLVRHRARVGNRAADLPRRRIGLRRGCGARGASAARRALGTALDRGARQRIARRLSRRVALPCRLCQLPDRRRARGTRRRARRRSRSAMSIPRPPTGPPRASSCSSRSSAGRRAFAAPFLAAAIFEALRTVASQYAPNVWQMSLGLGMLAIIMFLPAGLWSLARRRAA